MDYEKKYNEALERAKYYHDRDNIQFLENIFPELKESEDEKIRKGLIDFVNQYGDNFYGQISKEYAIAWLEKQGEHKHQYKSRPRYVGEEELLGANKQGEQILANSAKTCKDEQKPVPKFEVGDVMRTLQEAANNITSGLPVVVSIDDEYYRCNNESIAIKNQDDYEYPPMNRIQKPAWKPSDEQIGALEHFVRSITESGFASPYDSNTKLVYSLFNDLKKLREE